VASPRRDCGGLGRWRHRFRWAGRKLYAAPPAMRIVAIAGTILLVFTSINLVYHVLRKPTEIFVHVNGALNKAPAETWRRYAPLFREYSTAAITPELLAALAPVEGAGNPVARTYWRWRLSWNPFALYQPASSGVGMYQMTDAAFAEARPICIRNHVVVEAACWFSVCIRGWCRATPSSSRRFIWTAIWEPSSHACQTRTRRRSASRSSPLEFIYAAQLRAKPSHGAGSI